MVDLSAAAIGWHCGHMFDWPPLAKSLSRSQNVTTNPAECNEEHTAMESLTPRAELSELGRTLCRAIRA